MLCCHIPTRYGLHKGDGGCSRQTYGYADFLCLCSKACTSAYSISASVKLTCFTSKKACHCTRYSVFQNPANALVRASPCQCINIEMKIKQDGRKLVQNLLPFWCQVNRYDGSFPKAMKLRFLQMPSCNICTCHSNSTNC